MWLCRIFAFCSIALIISLANCASFPAPGNTTADIFEDELETTTELMASNTTGTHLNDDLRAPPFGRPGAVNGKPWWLGRNVCTEVDNSKKAAISSTSSASTFVVFGNGENQVSTQEAKNCVLTPELYFCTITRAIGNQTITETTKYQCCSGYKNSQIPWHNGRCIKS